MAQSLSKIYLHLIFTTKDRGKVISSKIEKELYAYISKIILENESYVIEVGGTSNHLHILIELSRKIAVSKLMELIKKRSSKWIKTKGIVFSKFSWQRGYGTFSVGQSQLRSVIGYIKNQKEHHKKITFKEEYRMFLKKYNIDYDEKYVWD